MKSLKLELPDRIAAELEQLVRAGFYANSQEAIGYALRDFLRHHAGDLAERHQREDIAWALGEARNP
jgi:Arc/MetJ-type ribon-helix-helix transcriptional regulator